ncbi:MAG: hypothetical protein IT457_23990 [Planctomycetes bacterium]|nr:hypothetical protein [Planctomycetota bacterium]
MNDTLTLGQFARAMQDLRAGKYTGEEAAEINSMLDALIGAAAPWIAERLATGNIAAGARDTLQQALAQADTKRVARRAEPAAMRAARAEGAAAARRAIERERFVAEPAPADPLAHLRMIRSPGELVAAEQRMSAGAVDAPITFSEQRDIGEALAALRFSTSSHAHAEATRAAKEWRFLKARNLSTLSLRDYVETSVRRWSETTPAVNDY